MSSDDETLHFAHDPLKLVDQLDPTTIRRKIEANVRERSALRKLLKLAEQTQGVRQDRQGDQP